MFVLKKLYIEDHSKIILDVSFSDDTFQKATSKNFISLIIGENGVGKSFLLKSLVEIFLFLEKIPVLQRKPKYRYEKFVLEYYLGNDLFSVQRNSGVEINYKKNELLIDYEELVLPQRMLAVSFMVNDKFFFSKNDKESVYKYLGVRASTNSTYTSSITNNIIQYLIFAVNSGCLQQIKESLTREIDFRNEAQAMITFAELNQSSKNESFTKKNTKTVKIDKINLLLTLCPM